MASSTDGNQQFHKQLSKGTGKNRSLSVFSSPRTEPHRPFLNHSEALSLAPTPHQTVFPETAQEPAVRVYA